jgi:hypothetical protein
MANVADDDAESLVFADEAETCTRDPYCTVHPDEDCPDPRAPRPARMNVTIEVVDAMYFVARTPCDQAWLGMRHTDDVKIVVERAMDHVADCANCRTS